MNVSVGKVEPDGSHSAKAKIVPHLERGVWYMRVYGGDVTQVEQDAKWLLEIREACGGGITVKSMDGVLHILPQCHNQVAVIDVPDTNPLAPRVLKGE